MEYRQKPTEEQTIEKAKQFRQLIIEMETLIVRADLPIKIETELLCKHPNMTPKVAEALGTILFYT